jgi:hypothetical protein
MFRGLSAGGRWLRTIGPPSTPWAIPITSGNLDQIDCRAGAAQVGSPTYASFARLLQESNMTRLHDSLTVIDGLVISKWSRAVIPTSYMKLKAREPSSLTGRTT